jgi:hypothetical protein
MAEEKEVKDIKKKCAQTGKTIKRAKRYYRNGLYFVNKAAFKAWYDKQREEKAAVQAEKKAADEKAAREAAEQKVQQEEQKPAEEAPASEEAPQSEAKSEVGPVEGEEPKAESSSEEEKAG